MLFCKFFLSHRHSLSSHLSSSPFSLLYPLPHTSAEPLSLSTAETLVVPPISAARHMLSRPPLARLLPSTLLSLQSHLDLLCHRPLFSSTAPLPPLVLGRVASIYSRLVSIGLFDSSRLVCRRRRLSTRLVSLCLRPRRSLSLFVDLKVTTGSGGD